MSTTETIEKEQFDESLQEELDQLEYYAHGDYVEIEVTAVERLSDHEVKVTFDPPAGSEFSCKMEIPVDPSYDTEFTRLLDSAGFNYSSASSIIGERVPFRYTDDGWEHVYVPYDDFVEKQIHKLQDMDFKSVLEIISLVGGLALFPISGLIILAWTYEAEDEDVGGGLMVYMFGLALWSMLVVLASPLVGL